MATATAADTCDRQKDLDRDSGVGSLNSGQTVICIYVPKVDVKVTVLLSLQWSLIEVCTGTYIHI